MASAAIFSVLTLRPWILRWFDARLTYWLWLIVPLAAAPTRVDRNMSDFAALLLAIWMTGAIGLFCRSIVSTRRFASDPAARAEIIAAHPTKRRVYAEALLKSRIVPTYRPLVCTWTSRSAQRLSERITMLGRPSLPLSRVLIGASLLAVISLALSLAA